MRCRITADLTMLKHRTEKRAAILADVRCDTLTWDDRDMLARRTA